MNLKAYVLAINYDYPRLLGQCIKLEFFQILITRAGNSIDVV